LPVSGLAAGTYLAMLVASLFIGPGAPAPNRRLAWNAMLILVGAAAGSAVWFTYVQKWVIGAFCPYCMATHITGLLLAALVLWRAARQFDDDSTPVAPTNPAAIATSFQDRSSSKAQRLNAAFPAVGLTLAGILAACQVFFVPPAVYHAGNLQNQIPVIDSHAAPLIGSPDAPYVVILLFDYRCPHCQDLHSMLDEAVRRYNGKLAFALCPAPLNIRCNPYIPRETPEFKDSCEEAKIGMAVWVADHQAFAEFDRWMFSPDPGQVWKARSLDAARAKAVELLGHAKFDAALADPWIDGFMDTSVQIFGDTIAPDQSGSAVPKLVFGSRWVTPQPNDAKDLLSILHNSLGVPTP
jgi:protein-disulfide isomerase